MLSRNQAPKSGKLGISNWLFDIPQDTLPHPPGYSVNYWADGSGDSSGDYPPDYSAESLVNHLADYPAGYLEDYLPRSLVESRDDSLEDYSADYSADSPGNYLESNLEDNLENYRENNLPNYSADSLVNRLPNYLENYGPSGNQRPAVTSAPPRIGLAGPIPHNGLLREANRWHPAMLPDNYLRKMKQDLAEADTLANSTAHFEPDLEFRDEPQSDDPTS